MADTLVKQVKLNIITDPGTALEKMDALNAKAERLKKTLGDGMAVDIDTAKASLKLALLREELRKTTTVGAGGGGGGFFGRLFGQAGGAAAGAAPDLAGLPLGLGGGGGAAAIAIIPAAYAGITLLTGLVSGLAAAAAGLGAFGVLSAGTFSQLKGDVSGYQAAWQKLNDTQNLVAVSPTKKNIAAEQRAQLALQAQLVGMGQDAGPAAVAINNLRLAYDKLSASLQPLTFKVITDATKAVTTFLPNLLPFAQAGGTAIDGLLTKVNTFFQSADFNAWVHKFLPIVGPAIQSIGDGIGKVMIAVGKLFTVMSSHDVAHAINVTFDIITGTINTFTGVISRLMSNWDRMTGAFQEGWKNIQRWSHEAMAAILGDALIVTGSFGALAGVITLVANEAANALGGITRFSSPLGGPGSGKLGHLAGGGPASGLTWVGEYGPELIYAPSGSYVYNAQQSRAMASGGNSYTVNVSVSPTANLAEVGRVTVAAIRAFEQRSGKSWRTS